MTLVDKSQNKNVKTHLFEMEMLNCVQLFTFLNG